MPYNIPEYWVMHRPRHPLYGTIMQGKSSKTQRYQYAQVIDGQPIPGQTNIPNVNQQKWTAAIQGNPAQIYNGDPSQFLMFGYGKGTNVNASYTPDPVTGQPPVGYIDWTRGLNTYAIMEDVWCLYAICYSLNDAQVVAERAVQFVGAGNVRVMQTMTPTATTQL